MYVNTCISNPYVQGIDPITTTGNTLENPWESRLILLEKQMAVLRTDLKLSRLKILALEGKFNQEEVVNIRKMLMSKDEASITLADLMIENA